MVIIIQTEKSIVNDVITEKIHNVPSVDLVIKSEKNNLIDLCKNNFPPSPEISQLINNFSSQFTSLENKIEQYISKNEEKYQRMNEKYLL